MAAPELSGLPETMRAIVDLIGLDDAILLVRELGGRHLYVAVHGKYGQCVSERLTEIVGADSAKKLIAQFRQDNPYIPMCSEALRNARNAKIIAEFDRLTTGDEPMSSNVAADQLAARHNMAARSIWRILKRPPQAPPPAQLTLL